LLDSSPISEYASDMVTPNLLLISLKFAYFLSLLFDDDML